MAEKRTHSTQAEYRIESGLNCGGHAFATEGYLLGPILEEFKQKKEQLIQSAHELMVKALGQKEMHVPEQPLDLKITVQGGVGTAEEHDFLLDHYEVDSVGWGSPFLLVPEATSVDKHTRDLLVGAKEDDLYLSHISPLGIPFNTLRGTTNEKLKLKRIEESKAGSSCPKRFLALSKEYDAKGICTSSKKFQDLKLEELLLQKGYFNC
jgi:NAD(P)H-dependent flavin oxidoreductase YrpB (nitropropane dioxygenase family)